MQPNRRDFLGQMGCMTAAATGLAVAGDASASDPLQSFDDKIGVLVDTTKCVGCRLCEYACKKSNDYDAGQLASYDDQSVFKEMRRPGPRSLTVINEFKDDGGKPVWVKINCMHCNHCACGSACIVGALRKEPNGAVTYDADKCIGCRYCMVACPFQLPAYSYDDVLTPQIFKCQFCFGNRTGPGKNNLPACVEACPREALTFGKRADLIALGYERIAKEPEKYIDHVYGEKELGGTSWMYVSNIPFEKIGLPKFGDDPPPAVTEKIQRGLFSPKFGVPPLLLGGILGAVMFFTRPRKKVEAVALPETPADAPKVAASVADDSSSHQHDDHDPHDEEPQPVHHKLLTPGVFLLIALMLFGIGCYLFRFIFGLAASTNLDQQRPWGLWIGIDVGSGVALAVGGFTAVVLAQVLHRETYKPLVRPAILTAMLGYTVVVTGLLADLGRWYNVWHPLMPTMWSPTSVLFTVGICEVICVHLLWIEFAPVFIERLEKEPNRFPKLTKLALKVTPMLKLAMPVLLIVGVVANFLHQTALGNLLVIAPYKLHPLWHSNILGLLFLVSAIAVGFPMMMFESLFASWSLKLKPEMHVLTAVAKLTVPMMSVYLVLKVADVFLRGNGAYLFDGSFLSLFWWIEVTVGALLPTLMLVSKKVRNSPRLLFAAAALLVAGLVFNRMNVFVFAYKPPFGKTYIPSIAEFGVTIGLFSALMLGYRVIVTYFPVISQPKKKGHEHAEPAAAPKAPPVEPSPAVATVEIPAVLPQVGVTA
jgi:Ni/Fe-hydrogenase subunit HybB-like protein/Fe-S-cluster-containing dehydrogenase component